MNKANSKLYPNQEKNKYPFTHLWWWRTSVQRGDNDHGLREWGRIRQLTAQNARQLKGWMRNLKCYCGSGMKFKKCCQSKHEKARGMKIVEERIN